MLRDRPDGSFLLALLCFVLALVCAVVPFALAALSNQTVSVAADALAPGARDIEANASGFPQTGSAGADLPDEIAEVWGAFDARLENIRADTGAPLEPLMGAAQYVARTEPMFAVEGADNLNLVGFAVDPRYLDRAMLVEGAWPVVPQSLAPGIAEGAAEGGADPIEIALSVRTAAELEWAIGEVRGAPFAMRLSGTFEAAEGSEDYWYHVPSVLTPRMWVDNAGRHINATAFLDPRALELLQGWQGATAVWYPFDADELHAADAPELAQQLRTFTANSFSVGSQAAGLGGVLSLTFNTETIAAIDAALATSRAMVAVVALTASAPIGVAVAVVLLACRIVSRGKRGALALLAARGASPTDARLTLALHGAVFGVVPALLGAAVAIVLALGLGVPFTPAALVGPALVAVLPVLIFWFTPPPPAGVREESIGEAAPSRSQRRLAAARDGVLIVLTLLATAALVAQTLTGSGVGSAGTRAAGAGADLLVAAVPLLWALVGCVIALRLYPLPLRALFAKYSRGPDLVGFLGTARSLRDQAVGVAPVLALVIGMSSAVTSGVMLGSIQNGIDATARSEVGADLQISRADLSPAMIDELGAVAGVDGVAPISSAIGAYVRSGRDLAVMTVLFADPELVQSVQDQGYPLIASGIDLGADGATIPVVISARGAGAIELSSGDVPVEVTLEGAPARIEGISAALAPAGIAPNWVLADPRHEERLLGERTAPTTAALVSLAPGVDSDTVTAAVRDVVGEDAGITTPAARAAELSSGPGASAIRVALIASTVGVALLVALTVMLTLALGSRGRDRTIALLRVLGASPRTGRALVGWELWPGVIAALIVGTAVGLALPVLLLWAVDLRAFTGSTTLGYHLDPLLLGAATLGFVALVALFTAIALALSRRVRAVSLLRAGQEG
ncbi:hypothetical protein LG299_09075 [Microbacterium lacus]|uniref:FtsX-like permease family protein n=1 Tax=Microbacterium lacus TaxID=415217 RepID=UPI00384DE5A6